MRAGLISGTALVAALLMGGAPVPASADCGMEAPPRHLAGYRGTAFIGSIVSRELVANSAGVPQGFILTIDVERPVAGAVASEVRVFGGEWGSSCHYFWAEPLRVGDRVLMSFRQSYTYVELPEDVVAAGPALVWRQMADDGWRFARRTAAFVEGYPPRAVEARRLPAILGMLRPRSLPDTSTGASTAPPVVPLMAWLLRLAQGHVAH